MRLLALAVALSVVLGALALGGCGGGGSAHQSASVSRARLAAYAHAVNLRAGDLPAAEMGAFEGFDSGIGHTSVAFTCRGGGLVGTSETVHSPEFVSSRNEELMTSVVVKVASQAASSSVQLEQSAAAARHDVAADRTRSVQECFGQYANAAGGARGPLVDNRVAVTPLPLALPSRADGFAFSAATREQYKSAEPQPKPANPFRARLESSEAHRGMSTDYLGFVAGRCVIKLVIEHETRYRAVDEERALRLLYSRAESHTL